MITIVLADDHSDVRNRLAQVLTREIDCRIVGEARNGAEAVGLTAHLEPDVIVLDLKMPVMDGVDATRVIKLDHPEVKVIAFTSTDTSTDVDRLLQVGVDAVVYKGDVEKLISLVTETVEEGA